MSVAELCHAIDYLLSASDRVERRHKKTVMERQREKKREPEKKRREALSEMAAEKRGA